MKILFINLKNLFFNENKPNEETINYFLERLEKEKIKLIFTDCPETTLRIGIENMLINKVGEHFGALARHTFDCILTNKEDTIGKLIIKELTAIGPAIYSCLDTASRTKEYFTYQRLHMVINSLNKEDIDRAIKFISVQVQY